MNTELIDITTLGSSAHDDNGTPHPITAYPLLLAIRLLLQIFLTLTSSILITSYSHIFKMKLSLISSFSFLPVLALSDSHNHNHAEPEHFSAKRLEDLASKWGTDV